MLIQHLLDIATMLVHNVYQMFIVRWSTFATWLIQYLQMVSYDFWFRQTVTSSANVLDSQTWCHTYGGGHLFIKMIACPL